MKLRRFGRTDLMLSEVGFGGWAIGGKSFGPVSNGDALDALARAEHLGCNLIDTAAVYGDSEAIIGRFLQTRRDKWIIASKYSGQEEGLRQTLEEQLARLRTDVIDFYQIHWMPSPVEQHLLDELLSLKEEGKVRYLGVSIYTDTDLERVLEHPDLDGFQLKISLLAPSPFHEYRDRIKRAGKGLLARSSLEEGFLTGKYNANEKFSADGDKRKALDADQIRKLSSFARAFQEVCDEACSLTLLATRYVLAFPEVSSLLLSTKNADQSNMNFGTVTSDCLTNSQLQRIESLQQSFRLFNEPGLFRKVVGSLRRMIRAR